MFISYALSVILLSLAMYGLWCLLRDLWQSYLQWRVIRIPSASFVMLVKDLEQEVELLVRYLAYQMQSAGVEGEVVVVDCGSSDLTPHILARLAGDFEALRVVAISSAARPASVALPLCQGAVVHVFDLINRLDREEFMAAVMTLLR